MMRDVASAANDLEIGEPMGPRADRIAVDVMHDQLSSGAAMLAAASRPIERGLSSPAPGDGSVLRRRHGPNIEPD